jgi:choline dehydrogenase
VAGACAHRSSAIGSAQLLQVSGIGPAAALRPHGIEVVAGLPGVGKNLQDHPGVSVVCAPGQALPSENNNVTKALGLLRSGEDLDYPDLQIAFADVSVTLPGALKPWIAQEILPGSDVGDDAALRAYATASVSSYYHPVGTCRMGTDDMAVVDPELRVHGISGLRVADASVMPSIVSANTNATVYAIAERAAELIRLAHGR